MTNEEEVGPVTVYFVKRGTRKIRVNREEWEREWLSWWNRKGSLARKQAPTEHPQQ
jgi:phage baseplate assembly protein gpV